MKRTLQQFIVDRRPSANRIKGGAWQLFTKLAGVGYGGVMKINWGRKMINLSAKTPCS